MPWAKLSNNKDKMSSVHYIGHVINVTSMRWPAMFNKTWAFISWVLFISSFLSSKKLLSAPLTYIITMLITFFCSHTYYSSLSLTKCLFFNLLPFSAQCVILLKWWIRSLPKLTGNVSFPVLLGTLALYLSACPGKWRAKSLTSASSCLWSADRKRGEGRRSDPACCLVIQLALKSP